MIAKYCIQHFPQSHDIARDHFVPLVFVTFHKQRRLGSVGGGRVGAVASGDDWAGVGLSGIDGGAGSRVVVRSGDDWAGVGLSGVDRGAGSRVVVCSSDDWAGVGLSGVDGGVGRRAVVRSRSFSGAAGGGRADDAVKENLFQGLRLLPDCASDGMILFIVNQ